MAATTTVGAAAESDLWVTVEGPSVVRSGAEATYTVHYGNNGPDTATDAYVSLDVPPGIPAPFPDITTDQRDAIAASASDTDTLGNLPLVFDDWACNNLLMQLQGPHDDQSATPIAPLAPGAEGAFSLTVTFPPALPAVGGLRIDAPTDLAGEIVNLGRGSCNDCGDIDGTCFGEPLSSFDLGSREAALAHESSLSGPSFGCNALVGDYSGRVVVFRRGSCSFGNKARYAIIAGAVGAVIVNDGQCFTGPDSDDCVIQMVGEMEDPSGFPVVMVSRADGEPLIAALEAGQDVRLTLGALPTRDPAFEATIFQSPAEDTDPVPGNDRATAITSINRLPVGAPVRHAPGGRVGG